MASRFTELVVDAHDCRALADFWAAALGYVVIDVDEADGAVEIALGAPHPEQITAAPIPPSLVFVPVPEDKAGKNRLHIDLRPIDGTRDEEVQRLLGLGASYADVGQGEQTWVVLADPEGNEFCVLRELPR